MKLVPLRTGNQCLISFPAVTFKQGILQLQLEQQKNSILLERKSFDRVCVPFLWQVAWFTDYADAKDHQRVLAAGKNQRCKKQQSLGLHLFTVLQTDAAHICSCVHTCSVSLSSNKLSLMKAAAWQSQRKRQCSVGSRVLVCKPAACGLQSDTG